MISSVRSFGRHYFSDPQAILLLSLLLVGSFLLLCMGQILAPVFASIIIAYLLHWIADLLIAKGMPRLLAVLLVYSAFLGFFLIGILILWPLVWQQLLRLIQELPSMITRVQQFIYLLPAEFPQYVTKETVDDWLLTFSLQVKQNVKTFVALSLTSIPSVISLIVYVVLVPLLVLFFLKDYQTILQWAGSFLPQNHQLLSQVWREVDRQMGNYIRGKAAEVIIVGLSTYLAFYIFDMRYAVLLSVLVGLSVLIPYVGAAVVTIPVVFVAFFQWGLGKDFAYLLLVYGVIQAIDGSVLVPLLFSGAVSLHPVAIILAILIFGGWWGFWGLFFAIP
ncbi:MAG TPA: AI-2E family transporter, partial [Candidatus Berkiella sp.]|nr:AI-2E family transporter [Candidatus Berkiella sp.]